MRLKTENKSKTDQDQRWGPHKTHLFLLLCSTKIDKFWTKRNHPVWKEIVREMEDHGLTGLDATTLCLKFRNLKKTYIQINRRTKNELVPTNPKWRFYNQMAAIVKDGQCELRQPLQPRTEEISINSDIEAIKHLQALQEYAMLWENYRAIGLLMQAEYAFKHPPEDKDFDIY